MENRDESMFHTSSDGNYCDEVQVIYPKDTSTLCKSSLTWKKLSGKVKSGKSGGVGGATIREGGLVI